MIHRARRSPLPLQIIVGTLLLCSSLLLAAAATEDLYGLLGVARTASVREIKRAYRRRALDTHPDKNQHLPPAQAAETFRRVVRAFEVLSDKQSRRRYDRTGRSDGDNGNGGSGRQQWTWHFHRRRRPVQQKLKDRFEVQQAQSRVLHVVSLEQLHTVMTDDDDTLERSLLLCFTTPLTELLVQDDMVFPYPFAAMSSQGIWWEDLLQTVQVRFHRSNNLSQHFGISSNDINESRQPIFVFGRRGQNFTQPAHFAKLQTNNRHEFETWVWNQIQVELVIENQHSHAVEVYWIHGTTAKLKMILQPAEKATHTTMLSHEWYVRDTRVDTFEGSPGRHKLTVDSSLGSWKIVNDTTPQRLIVRAGQCFDLSGHCGFWQQQGECHKNPRFMAEQCQRTCHLCDNIRPQQETIVTEEL
jgi:curved DNA-binding protein CbpA